MVLYIGPLVLGFLLGFILGTRIKPNPESKLNFNVEVYAIVLIVTIVVAYYTGPFPYYVDMPLASGIVAAIIGILVGKVTLGR